MQKIMFDHRRFGLEQAVLERKKIMTRRAVRLPDRLTAELIYDPVMGIDPKGRVYFTVDIIDGKRDLYPQYQIGEVVAVAQAYKNDDVLNYLAYDEHGEKRTDGYNLHQMALQSPGYKNKMFVRADLMPHRIKITNIGLERLQDITDEDILREGVEKVEDAGYTYRVSEINGKFFACCDARMAFEYLIDKISGSGTWDDNPWVWVYEFELIK